MKRVKLIIGYLRKITAIFLMTVFFLQVTISGSWSAVDGELPDSFLTGGDVYAKLEIETLVVPGHLGEIKRSFIGDPGKVLIHIQDAHCNPFAQEKIAELITYLNAEYGIKTVNLEGGVGAYDLSVFHSISGKVVRREVADHYVQKGDVNGAEYYAINNPGKVDLWGVEDKDLYLANLRVYRDSVTSKDTVDRYMKQLDHIVGNLKRHIFPNELAKIDTAFHEYKSKKTRFRDYAELLLERSYSYAIPVSDYRNLSLLNKSLECEEELDFEKANDERLLLIDDLKEALSRYELRELLTKSVDFKTKKISRNSFYAYLFDKSRQLNLDTGRYGALNDYREYISAYESIDRSVLFEELDSLEGRIKDQIISTNTERELDDLSHDLALLRNIFIIALNKRDYSYYLDNRDSFDVVNFTDFYDKESPKYKMSFKPEDELPELDGLRNNISGFYDYSFKRDGAFVRNMKLTDTGSADSGIRSAILMTGGFHTENLCEILESKNISYVSILPLFVTPKNWKSPYFDILAGRDTGISGMLKAVMPQASMMAIASRMTSLSDAGLLGGVEERERFELSVLIYAKMRESERDLSVIGEDGSAMITFDVEGNEVKDPDRKRTEEVTISDLLGELRGIHFEAVETSAESSPTREEALRYLENDPDAWVSFMDMAKAGLRNSVYGNKNTDLLIEVAFETVNTFLSSIGGMAYSISGDEIGALLPSGMTKEQVETALRDLQTALVERFEDRFGFVELSQELSAEMSAEFPSTWRDGKVHHGTVTTEKVGVFRNKKTDEFRNVTGILYEKTSGEDAGPFREFLRERNYFIEDVKPVFVPLEPAGVVKAGNFEEVDISSKLDAAISSAEKVQTANKTGSLVTVLEDVEANADADEALPVLSDEADKVIGESLEGARTNYSDNFIVSSDEIDAEYPALNRFSLWKAINIASKSEKPVSFLIIGKPDTFYVVRGSGREGGLQTQLLKIKTKYGTKDEGTIDRFKTILGASGRGKRKSDTGEDFYYGGFKELQDGVLANHLWGDSMISLISSGMFNAFSNENAASQGDDSVTKGISEASRFINSNLNEFQQGEYDFNVAFDVSSINLSEYREMTGEEKNEKLFSEMISVVDDLLEVRNSAESEAIRDREAPRGPPHTYRSFTKNKEENVWKKITEESSLIAGRVRARAGRSLLEEDIKLRRLRNKNDIGKYETNNVVPEHAEKVARFKDEDLDEAKSSDGVGLLEKILLPFQVVKEIYHDLINDYHWTLVQEAYTNMIKYGVRTEGGRVLHMGTSASPLPILDVMLGMKSVGIDIDDGAIYPATEAAKASLPEDQKGDLQLIPADASTYTSEEKFDMVDLIDIFGGVQLPQSMSDKVLTAALKATADKALVVLNGKFVEINDDHGRQVADPSGFNTTDDKGKVLTEGDPVKRIQELAAEMGYSIRRVYGNSDEYYEEIDSHNDFVREQGLRAPMSGAPVVMFIVEKKVETGDDGASLEDTEGSEEITRENIGEKLPDFSEKAGKYSGLDPAMRDKYNHQGMKYSSLKWAGEEKPPFEKLLKLGGQHGILAHGIDISKGGLSNLLLIMLNGAIAPSSASYGDGTATYFGVLDDAEYGREGDIQTTAVHTVSGLYAPFFVILDDRVGRRTFSEGIPDEYHQSFLVPNEEMRNILFEGVEEALGSNSAEAEELKSKVMTYQEFVDLVGDSRARSLLLKRFDPVEADRLLVEDISAFEQYCSDCIEVKPENAVPVAVMANAYFGRLTMGTPDSIRERIRSSKEDGDRFRVMHRLRNIGLEHMKSSDDPQYTDMVEFYQYHNTDEGGNFDFDKMLEDLNAADADAGEKVSTNEREEAAVKVEDVLDIINPVEGMLRKGSPTFMYEATISALDQSEGSKNIKTIERDMKKAGYNVSIGMYNAARKDFSETSRFMTNLDELMDKYVLSAIEDKKSRLVVKIALLGEEDVDNRIRDAVKKQLEKNMDKQVSVLQGKIDSGKVKGDRAENLKSIIAELSDKAVRGRLLRGMKLITADYGKEMKYANTGVEIWSDMIGMEVNRYISGKEGEPRQEEGKPLKNDEGYAQELPSELATAWLRLLQLSANNAEGIGIDLMEPISSVNTVQGNLFIKGLPMIVNQIWKELKDWKINNRALSISV